MVWSPKYSISDALVATIRQIGEILGEMRARSPKGNALATLRHSALELSTFASTSIEGNPLRLTDVRRLLKDTPQQARDTEREILNYNEALEALHRELRNGTFDFSPKTLEKIQSKVVQGLMRDSRDVGHIRRDPVVIRHATRPDTIVFLPPDARDVRKLIRELFDFVRSRKTTIDSIILAGLFHRQCVIIHPFMDGNGRTTRLMTTALLGLSGIDLFEIFSFEAFYNRNVTRYFATVGLTGDYYELESRIDHSEWLEYFAEGILDELLRVLKTLPSMTDHLGAHLLAILEHLGEHGSLSQKEYGQWSDRSLAARKQDLKKLVERGYITRVGQGRSTRYRLSDTA